MNAKHLQTNLSLSADQLAQHGVVYQYITPDPQTYQTSLDHWKQQRNYIAQDQITLTPNTPNLETLLEKFSKEHLHTDDEVRYILSGSGIFDIRSIQDEWIRLTVHAGDFIIVPANMYHRFTLTDEKKIDAIRLFKENPSWVPIYRT